MQERDEEVRRALVLHHMPPVVDPIEPTLNHGLFAVRAPSRIEEAERILRRCSGPTVMTTRHDENLRKPHIPRQIGMLPW